MYKESNKRNHYIACIDTKKGEIIEKHSLEKRLTFSSDKHPLQNAYYFLNQETHTHTIVDDSFNVLFETEKEVVHIIEDKGVIVKLENEGNLNFKDINGQYSYRTFYQFLSFGTEIKAPHFSHYFISGKEVYLFELPLFIISESKVDSGVYTSLSSNKAFQVNENTIHYYRLNNMYDVRCISVSELEQYDTKFLYNRLDKNKNRVYLGDKSWKEYESYLELYRKIYESYDFVFNTGKDIYNRLTPSRFKQLLNLYENSDNHPHLNQLIWKDSYDFKQKIKTVEFAREFEKKKKEKEIPPAKGNALLYQVVFLITVIIAMSFTELGKIIITIGIVVSVFGTLHWMNKHS